MNRYTPSLVALGGGLLLCAAWPMSPATILIFVAWLPLLWLEATIKSRKQFFALTYLVMLIWNIGTTWWIWNASAPGAVAAFLANSLLMCLPWLGLKIARKWLGASFGYLSLLAFWMCFEFIHLQDWGLSWPWLTLGNVFATHPGWVQWYEVTGTSGGTCWVLAVNILLFRHLQVNQQKQEPVRRSFRFLSLAIVALFIPFCFSWLFNNFNRTHQKTAVQPATTVVIVQPNIDPYEKVSEATGSFENQLQTLIQTSEEKIDSNTTLVIWPETALYSASRIDEDHLRDNFFLAPLWGFLEKHPQLVLFTGIESFREMPRKTAYTDEFNGHFYESYNGSLVLNRTGVLGTYHKSMLVPGVETLPWFLKFIATWFEKFGGTTAGYARQSERTVLKVSDAVRIAPAICYESIYGEFMSRYVRRGANLVCIITNDGWWKNTPGHKQHMSYARLRAIETRTWVARSANTGISCFIDPVGNVISPQAYDTKAAIRLSITTTANKTFFVQHGDILSRVMVALSLLLLGWTITKKIRQHIQQRKEQPVQ